MRDGMAKGWYEKPKGLGTDNMSCIILRFKPGHADDAVLHPELKEEQKTEVPNDGTPKESNEEESKIQKDVK
jgi:hypothetical protein